ncbi:MAG: hypothetical protein ACKON7_09235, partial [Planctomycetaceae bacterium]
MRHLIRTGLACRISRTGRGFLLAGMAWMMLGPGSAVAQNDWQFPDPYFGAFQHRSAGTLQAEQRYRAEIAPQQPLRLHDIRPPAARPRP